MIAIVVHVIVCPYVQINPNSNDLHHCAPLHPTQGIS